MNIVNVLLPINLENSIFSYICETNDNSLIGKIVIVPFKNKSSVGIVLEENVKIIAPKFQLKKLEKILNTPPFSPEFIKFIKESATYNLSGIGNFFNMTIPNIDHQEELNPYQYITSMESLPGKVKQKTAQMLQKYLNKKVTLSEIIKLEKLTKRKLLYNYITKNNIKLHSNNKIDYPQIIIKEPARLTPEQMLVIKNISHLIKKDINPNILLDAITGAGKTEIFIALISEELTKKANQILILVPEIHLIPQMEEMIKKRLNIEVIIWHSELTQSQRQYNWYRIIYGAHQVIISTRSGLYLPYNNLSLIILDEEHDLSYKQQSAPYYHARSMAILKSEIQKIPIILSSATPSIETEYMAKKNIYHHIELKRRYLYKLPEVTIIKVENKKILLSPEAIQLIKQQLQKKLQTLIFLNQKGYAPMLKCYQCNSTYNCIRCSCLLTVHSSNGKVDKLLCHRCNYTTNFPKSCFNCNNEKLSIVGTGIDKLYKEIRKLLPYNRTVVVTRENISNQVVEDIRKHKYDLIVSTQILSKGYNFPKLNAVIIANADIGMRNFDPRALENTYQALHQVSGRAGRFINDSRVIIQTSENQEASLFNSLKNWEKQTFIDSEIDYREQNNMPPFAFFTFIKLSSKNEEILIKFAQEVSRLMPNIKNESINIYGPVQPHLYKLNNSYRIRFVCIAKLKAANKLPYFSTEGIQVKSLIKTWISQIKQKNSVTVHIETDPYDFS